VYSSYEAQEIRMNLAPGLGLVWSTGVEAVRMVVAVSSAQLPASITAPTPPGSYIPTPASS